MPSRSVSTETGQVQVELGLIERGERMPRIDTLLKLAAALEADPSELLEGMRWVPAEGEAEGSFEPAPGRHKGHASS